MAIVIKTSGRMMTREEASKKITDILLRYAEELPAHYDEEVEDYVFDSTEEINEILILNKIIKTALRDKWHNLRKNPDDLPEKRRRILFYTKYCNDELERQYWTGEFFDGEFYNDDYEGCVTNSSYSINEVSKWLYVESFEEEDEE